MKPIWNIALVAHDRLKPSLVEWALSHKPSLKGHRLFATGTTGQRIKEATGLKIHCFKSGPLGGDQQIGARICQGEMDLVVFFWDPLQPQPHDVDVKALLRIAVLYDVPIACNRRSADLMLLHGLSKNGTPYKARNRTPKVRRA